MSTGLSGTFVENWSEAGKLGLASKRSLAGSFPKETLSFPDPSVLAGGQPTARVSDASGEPIGQDFGAFRFGLSYAGFERQTTSPRLGDEGFFIWTVDRAHNNIVSKRR